MDIKQLVKEMPKAELHVHIEGTLEPKMLLGLAAKNGVEIPFRTLADVEAAYEFEDLQSFLDIYYAGASVLINESDFFDLMYAYLKRCQAENIVHAEIMFDPQTHLERGISFETMFKGYHKALLQAEQDWGQSANLIMCFFAICLRKAVWRVLKKPSRSNSTFCQWDWIAQNWDIRQRSSKRSTPKQLNKVIAAWHTRAKKATPVISGVR